MSDPSEVGANVAQKAVDTYNSYASAVDKLIKSRPYEDISVERRQLSDKFREAAKPYEYKDSGEYAPHDEKFCTHILAIPTTKMLDEMTKSADWAVALV